MDSFKYLKIIIRDEFFAFREEFKESKLLFVAFILSLIALFFYLDPFPSKKINIATGYEKSDWHSFGKSASSLLKERGLTTSIITSDGAIDNVEKLINKSEGVNVAFTYGGALNQEQMKGIYSLGSVSYEPIWIFYRKSKTGEINDISNLSRFKVGLGPPKSGSYILAKKLFELNRIDIANDTHFISKPFNELENDFIKGDLDVYVRVASAHDPVIYKLLRQPGVELFNFKYAGAYQKRMGFVEAVTLPAGSINLYEKIPKQDTELVATTASLVVRDDMHPDVQLALLMATKDVIRTSKNLFFAKRSEFPAYVDPLIQISPVAEHFYDYGPPHAARYLPFWMAGFIDRAWILLLTLLAIFYPLSKLNIRLREFRYSIRKGLCSQKLVAIKECLQQGKLSEGKKNELLGELSVIKNEVTSAGAPAGKEGDYIGFLYLIDSLDKEIKDN